MKNRVLTTIVCVFIAIVLATGGCLTLVTVLRNSRAVVVCGNVTADEGTVRYLASYYKMLYIRSLRTAGVDAEDSESFWSSFAEDGRTYGELYTTAFNNYLASILAGANIYLTYSHYSAEDKLRVAETTEEILKYKADGSVDLFNEMAEDLGFDYHDFQNAAALIYKARHAEEVIYGTSGENLKNYPELCNEYLGTYSHVSLIFIRLNGDMTDEERAKKQAQIDLLTNAMAAAENGENGGITKVMFNEQLALSDGDPAMYETGYYFHPSAEKTAEFADPFPEVVNASLEMEIGEYRRVDCSVGVWFIYKDEPVAGDYDKSIAFFSDFYADAALYQYDKVLSELIPTVTYRPSYSEIDILAIPTVNEFYIREFK